MTKATHRTLVEWASKRCKAINNSKLVRFLLIMNLSVLRVFFLLKKTKNEKIYQRVEHNDSFKSYTPNAFTATTTKSSFTFNQRFRKLFEYQDQVESDGSKEEYKLIEARSALPPIDRFLRRYYKISYYYNWWMLVKYSIVWLLRFDTFSHLKYLDCFLLGRFSVNGRVVERANTCACYLIIIHLFWLHLLCGMKGSKLKLSCIEFMLKTPDEVIHWCTRDSRGEVDTGLRLKLVPFNRQTNRPNLSCRRPKRDKLANCHQNNYNHSHSAELHSSLFEFRDSYVMSSSGRQGQDTWKYKLRPNRTLKCWLHLARVVLRFNLVFAPFMLLLIIIFFRMFTPVMITQTGFELSYAHCMRWLTTSDNNSNNNNAPLPLNPSLNQSEAIISATKRILLELAEPPTIHDATTTTTTSDSSDLVMALKQTDDSGAFKATKVIGDFMMPYDGLVAFNYYHTIRIILDMTDTLIIYFQTALLMSSMGMIAIILIEDLMLQAEHLNKRLKRQTKAFRLREMFNRSHKNSIYMSLKASHQASRSRNNSTTINRLDGERFKPAQMGQLDHLIRRHTKSINNHLPGLSLSFSSTSSSSHSPSSSPFSSPSSIDVQAQVADLFKTMHNYNRYIQYQTLFLVTLWLSYSSLVTSWIFIPGNNSPKFEWYILHCFATVYLFIFLSRFGAFKRCTREMYKLISTAMALDDDCKFSKVTWMALLQFYWPVPLHCFTFITKIELDILFGLKMLAWLVSALIVTASFFTPYRIE